MTFQRRILMRHFVPMKRETVASAESDLIFLADVTHPPSSLIRHKNDDNLSEYLKKLT